MKVKFNTEIMNTRFDLSKNVFKSPVHGMAYCKFNLAGILLRKTLVHIPLMLAKRYMLLTVKVMF